MDADALRALQAPIKAKYREAPDAAVITLRASGEIDESKISCKLETGRAMVEAGLHPASGGTGMELCSGDMLLEALVACAGVTLKAVATALDIPLRKGTVRAEGDLVARELRRVDDLGEGELGLDVLDARLDERVLLAGRVVLGVLAQVAVLAGRRDLLDHLRALDALELLELFLQTLVPRRGHRDRIHGGPRS